MVKIVAVLSCVAREDHTLRKAGERAKEIYGKGNPMEAVSSAEAFRSVWQSQIWKAYIVR